VKYLHCAATVSAPNRGDKSDTASVTMRPEQEVGDTIFAHPLPGLDQEG